jgi:hypothetical protein
VSSTLALRRLLGNRAVKRLVVFVSGGFGTGAASRMALLTAPPMVRSANLPAPITRPTMWDPTCIAGPRSNSFHSVASVNFPLTDEEQDQIR